MIFGVTGQDGSYLAELLVEKGYEVVGVARRCSHNNLERLNDVIENPLFELVEGDVTDPHNILSLIIHYLPDEVYNLAAQSHVGTSFSQPTTTWDITATGCLNILEAIRFVNKKCAINIRMYQASSSEMFGNNYNIKETNLEQGLDIKTGKVLYKDIYGNFTNSLGPSKYQDETTPLSPQSPYAIAKVAAHHSVRLYRESYGIHASCGILFNHESERRGKNFVTRKITDWIGKFYNFCEGHPEEVVVGDGGSLFYHKTGAVMRKLQLGNVHSGRDWGYAPDYVKAMWLMLQKSTPDDYVVATGRIKTVLDFLREAFGVIGVTNYYNFFETTSDLHRPSEVHALCGMPSKAFNRLSWKPEHNFYELVEKMVQHDIEEHKNG